MNVKRQLWSLVRMMIPVLGFLVTCLGTYLVTLQNQYTLILIPVYILIALGFLSTLIGVFWNICHSMKSKMYHRGSPEPNIQVFTIERPRSFPPSYQQSQESWVCAGSPSEVVVATNQVETSPAPPLYSRDRSETPDCTWSWEPPPRYSQVEMGAGRTAGGGHTEVSSGL